MKALNPGDYICYTYRGELEYSVWLGDGTHRLIGLKQHFDSAWPTSFPRPPLYRVKWIKERPVIMREIKYTP